MKKLNDNNLSLIQGGGFWNDFIGGACTVVGAADASASVAVVLGSVINPALGTALIIGSVACASWGIYTLVKN